MKIAQGETVVAVAATDGFRYVAVTPPLSEDEVEGIRSENVFDERFYVRQIADLEPQCSMVMVSGSLDPYRTPENRTEYAQRVAAKLAGFLRTQRDGNVRHERATTPIVGYLSSPFNPNTDVLRA